MVHAKKKACFTVIRKAETTSSTNIVFNFSFINIKFKVQIKTKWNLLKGNQKEHPELSNRCHLLLLQMLGHVPNREQVMNAALTEATKQFMSITRGTMPHHWAQETLHTPLQNKLGASYKTEEAKHHHMSLPCV